MNCFSACLIHFIRWAIATLSIHKVFVTSFVIACNPLKCVKWKFTHFNCAGTMWIVVGINWTWAWDFKFPACFEWKVNIKMKYYFRCFWAKRGIGETFLHLMFSVPLCWILEVSVMLGFWEFMWWEWSFFCSRKGGWMLLFKIVLRFTEIS